MSFMHASCVYSVSSGDLLASTSGDGTIKLWNLSQSMSTLTLSDHRQPGTNNTIIFV